MNYRPKCGSVAPRRPYGPRIIYRHFEMEHFGVAKHTYGGFEESCVVDAYMQDVLESLRFFLIASQKILLIILGMYNAELPRHVPAC